jgi:hypothetical protein
MINSDIALVSGDARYQLNDWFDDMNTHTIIKDNVYHKFSPDFLIAAEARFGFVLMPGGARRWQGLGTYSQPFIHRATRMESVADPADVNKKCWLHRVFKEDTTGPNNDLRSEILHGILDLYGKTLTAGFSVRVPDYTNVNDQFLVFQCHSGGGNPWLALNFDRGDLELRVRHQVGEDIVHHTVYTTDNWLPNTWINFSISFRRHITDGFVKCFVNGQDVGSYIGPVGYGDILTPVLSGIYKWNQPTNWDNSLSETLAYIKGLYVIYGDEPNKMTQFLAEL